MNAKQIAEISERLTTEAENELFDKIKGIEGVKHGDISPELDSRLYHCISELKDIVAEFIGANIEKTYDVVFNDNTDINCKGFKESYEYCQNYIRTHNGTKESYFADYKGGMVSIVCNETEEMVFRTEVL